MVLEKHFFRIRTSEKSILERLRFIVKQTRREHFQSLVKRVLFEWNGSQRILSKVRSSKVNKRVGAFLPKCSDTRLLQCPLRICLMCFYTLRLKISNKEEKLWERKGGLGLEVCF
jgi:hypothetical protein